jgi:hypothetical protein
MLNDCHGTNLPQQNLGRSDHSCVRAGGMVGDRRGPVSYEPSTGSAPLRPRKRSAGACHAVGSLYFPLLVFQILVVVLGVKHERCGVMFG